MCMSLSVLLRVRVSCVCVYSQDTCSEAPTYPEAESQGRHPAQAAPRPHGAPQHPHANPSPWAGGLCLGLKVWDSAQLERSWTIPQGPALDTHVHRYTHTGPDTGLCPTPAQAVPAVVQHEPPSRTDVSSVCARLCWTQATPGHRHPPTLRGTQGTRRDPERGQRPCPGDDDKPGLEGEGSWPGAPSAYLTHLYISTHSWAHLHTLRSTHTYSMQVVLTSHAFTLSHAHRRVCTHTHTSGLWALRFALGVRGGWPSGPLGFPSPLGTPSPVTGPRGGGCLGRGVGLTGSSSPLCLGTPGQQHEATASVCTCVCCVAHTRGA